MADYIGMKPAGRGAAIRSREGFSPISDFSESSAGKLARALGVTLDIIPKVAEFEGQKAEAAGVDARIAEVRRENANDANNGLFSGLFRKRAEDGFDFTDAQIAAPEIALQEQVEMYDALKDSTNPDDFKTWVAGRNEALKGTLEGKSRVYQKTLATELLKVREQQARTFGGWVISNREKAARQAAAAAARGAAARAAALKEAAALSAYEQLADGGNLNEEMARFVTEAPEVYGIPSSEARQIFTQELMNYADESNDPDILGAVDPRLFDAKGREKVADAADTIWSNRNARENAAREAADRDQKVALEAQEAEVNSQTFGLALDVLTGKATPSEAFSAIAGHPLFKQKPQMLNTVMETILGPRSKLADPAFERLTVTSATSEMIDAAIRGEDYQGIAANALQFDLVSPESRKAVVDTMSDIQGAIEARMLDPAYLEPYERELTKVLASGTGADSQDYAASRGLPGGGPPPLDPGTAQNAVQEFRVSVIQRTMDWVKEDPNRSTAYIPRSVRKDIVSAAFDEIVAPYQLSAQDLAGSAGAGAASAVDALNSILGASQ